MGQMGSSGFRGFPDGLLYILMEKDNDDDASDGEKYCHCRYNS